jgi:2-polyprenyl-6-methoxyphenol hydroxylase-like FAD-dependent oxidoreductase
VTTRSILISGAGIAGPTLASWLSAAGWQVTVVERFGHLREQGQNVDVRGTARKVLRRMGLEDAVRAVTTRESGLDFVDDTGRPIASIDAGTGDSAGPTAELEVVRGRLARILADHSAADAEYLFGEQIAGLDDDGDGVTVSFASGIRRRFDVVAIAEGLRSRTRAIVMPEARIHELGVYCAYLTIARTGTDTDRWRWLLSPHRRTVALRPNDSHFTTATLTWRTPVRGLDRLDRAEIVALVRKTFAGIGWETPRILAALDDCPMYFEALGQARLPVWSRGRVVLVGDAAWAASPFAGIGATLAITGAYILAGELSAQPDPGTAFARYEKLMRPMVTAGQKSAPTMSRLAHPGSRLERTLLQRPLLRFGAWAAASPLMQRLSGAGGGESTAAGAIELPDYP